MSSRFSGFSGLSKFFSVAGLAFVLVPVVSLHAQDDTSHLRKYKAPPPTSHVEVLVKKKFNGKPIPNAAVVFDATLNGKDEGNLEVKTDPDGKAQIDVIATGSTVRVQVIATGFATYAKEYLVDGPQKSIEITLLRPQEQISDYVDNSGKTSTRKPGVQDPVRPPTTVAPSTSSTPAAPAAAAPKQ